MECAQEVQQGLHNAGVGLSHNGLQETSTSNVSICSFHTQANKNILGMPRFAWRTKEQLFVTSKPLPMHCPNSRSNAGSKLEIHLSAVCSKKAVLMKVVVF